MSSPGTPSMSLLGKPCKIITDTCEIYGRYVGDSTTQSSEDTILIICTPSNSIIHARKSSVSFDMETSDFLILKDFEDDARNEHEWYHSNGDKDRLKSIGILISYTDILPLDI